MNVNTGISVKEYSQDEYSLRDTFFWGEKNGAFDTKNGAFRHLLLVCTIFFVYIVYTLFVRVVITVWLSQATMFLFLSIMALLRTRLSWARTTFSTVGCANLFLCLLCIHPPILHKCCGVAVYPPSDTPQVLVESLQRHLSLQNTTAWRTMPSYQTKLFRLNPWCLACTSYFRGGGQKQADSPLYGHHFRGNHTCDSVTSPEYDWHPNFIPFAS